MRAPKASTLLAVIALVITACGGTTYVQPEMPTAGASGPVLPLRALSLSFDRGIASVDASGQMRFGDVVVGTFAESGTFTVEGGSVWANMSEDGTIGVNVDDPAQSGPSRTTFTTSGDRLVHPDGTVIATLDASGQIATSSGSFPVTGITSRARRLALFLYLVAATYAEDVPEAGTGETP
ncbi:MAG: hypothetical protein J0L92_17775 [Deltaproteobacteria bacterium]|nr:hypothetical protein [Deltaproteobacteria bacterium]